MTLGNDGNFYGTTAVGGNKNITYPNGMGTVFQFMTNGTLTTLVSLSGTNGASPEAALTLGNDGNFYGTTEAGGIIGEGTVFQVTTNGTLTTLVSFNGTNGASPAATLTLGNDGNFYGTTKAGGPSGQGTVFQVTTNGTLTTLVSFNGPNGESPEAALTLGNDGNFYGTTEAGGGSGVGTVFQLTTNGAFTTLTAFDGGSGWHPNGLTLGTDGNFYGTTQSGGSSDGGTVFQVTSNGVLRTLVSFTVSNGGGESPIATLTQGGDGNFYGTTLFGGSGDQGTLFQVTTNGALTTLFTFNAYTGEQPGAPLTIGPDANLYGTTEVGGGSSYWGTVFRLLLPPVILVQPQNQTNNAGTTVTFAVSATSLNPIGFQWQQDGTNLSDGGNISGSTSNILTITDISDSDTATYSVIVSNANFSITNFAVLTVVDPPVITAQPTNMLVPPGMNAVFAPSLTGSASSFCYQWLFNGTNILNATNAVYTIPSVLTNNAGYYSLIVTNQAGTATSSNAALTVVLSPQSQTNNAGNTATFTATAFSPESLNFQWQKNGTSLINGGKYSGAATSTLIIANVSDTEAAVYSAVVSDATASVTTSNAVLTVIDAPFITAQPTNVMVLLGANVAFGATLTGSTSYFNYQWKFNGTNILNATNAIYTISSVVTNYAGYYSLTVSNLAGSVTSSNAILSVVLSPTNRTNHASSAATFAAIAFSPELLNYQWQKNGTNLVNNSNVSGVTNSTLTITNVQDADAAIYSAIVSDAFTSVITSNALLTVNDLPYIATQPQSQTVLAGDTVTFSAAAYGGLPLVFQWYFNGAPIGPPVSGTNFAIYTITNVRANQAGNYAVEVINAYGSVMSSNATLTESLPPVITVQPTSQTNKATTTANFSVTVTSLSALSYQWQQNGTNLLNGGKFSGVATNTLTITGVSSNEASIYSVIVTNLAGSVTSSNVMLTVIYPPTITAQPSSLLVLPGTNVAFGVSLNGATPFSYEWRLNGTNIVNATNANFVIAPVLTNNAGNYSVIITNAAGSVTSSVAGLTVLLSPTNQAKVVNSNATFTAIAFSPAAVAYQWQQNGTNLSNGLKFSGVTTYTLTITGVSSNEAGIYAVTVTNAAGSVTSSNATLTVIYPPAIIMQPVGQRLVIGSAVSFNVGLSGTAPFYYHWRFNGGNLANATNAAYVIQAINTNNTGNYSVVVTNLAGIATSSNAMLTVLIPPTLTLEIGAGYPLLTLNGMLSNTFTIQYSTNLTGTNWITLLSLSNLVTSPYLFLDPAGNDQPTMFYRALMQ